MPFMFLHTKTILPAVWLYLNYVLHSLHGANVVYRSFLSDIVWLWCGTYSDFVILFFCAQVSHDGEWAFSISVRKKKGVKSERAFLGKPQHTFSSSPSAKAYSVITSHVSQAWGFDGIIISLIFLFFL